MQITLVQGTPDANNNTKIKIGSVELTYFIK